MDSPILSLTVIGLTCLAIIVYLHHDGAIQRKHFWYLCLSGVPAYLLMVVVMFYGKTAETTLIFFLVAALLVFCLLALSCYLRLMNMTSREFTLLTFAGQTIVIVGLGARLVN
jgi:uncharacterized membrane protein YhaH (DUF805 family)